MRAGLRKWGNARSASAEERAETATDVCAMPRHPRCNVAWQNVATLAHRASCVVRGGGKEMSTMQTFLTRMFPRPVSIAPAPSSVDPEVLAAIREVLEMDLETQPVSGVVDADRSGVYLVGGSVEVERADPLDEGARRAG